MRVDADDFARPCSCGREHHIDVREIVIESGAIGKLEKEMSDGDLKECISPLLICDTNSYKATEELMEDIYDRCQVLILDAEGLEADERAVEIVENYMEEDRRIYFHSSRHDLEWCKKSISGICATFCFCGYGYFC